MQRIGIDERKQALGLLRIRQRLIADILHGVDIQMVDFLIDDAQQQRTGLLRNPYGHIMRKGCIPARHEIRIFSLPDIILGHRRLDVGHIRPALAHGLQTLIDGIEIDPLCLARIHGLHMRMRKEVPRDTGYPRHLRQLPDAPRHGCIAKIDIGRGDIEPMCISPAVVTVDIQEKIRFAVLHALEGLRVRAGRHDLNRDTQIIRHALHEFRQNAAEGIPFKIGKRLFSRHDQSPQHLLIRQIAALFGRERQRRRIMRHIVLVGKPPHQMRIVYSQCVRRQIELAQQHCIALFHHKVNGLSIKANSGRRIALIKAVRQETVDGPAPVIRQHAVDGIVGVLLIGKALLLCQHRQFPALIFTHQIAKVQFSPKSRKAPNILRAAAQKNH